MSVEAVMVYTTTPDEESARRIASGLVERRLAACVSFLPGVESHFWWEGKVDVAREHLLIIKTRRSLLKEVLDEAKRLHPYSVPELLAVAVSSGSEDYLKWVEDSTRPGDEPPR